ncbi:MAG TPA: DUF4331 family protein [Kofleriaceae bacterium]
MKKLAFLAIAGGLAGMGLGALMSTPSQASDHLDATALAQNPMADIGDIYAWMTTTNVDLAMTVSPADNGSRTFGTSVQYVFHIMSKTNISTIGSPNLGTPSNVICTFASNTSVQCWVTDGAGAVKDYVTGDPSNPAGIYSADNKVHVFAGQRSDPFFFNLQGFHDALGYFATHDLPGGSSGATYNGAGCPAITTTDATAIQSAIGEPAQATAAAPCATDNRDCFIHLNVMALVVQVDRSLLNDGANTIIGVWGSTNQGS